MIRTFSALVVLAGLAAALPARADTPVTSAFELKLGSYRPQIDSEPSLNNSTYNTAFGGKSILLFELEWERQFFQKFGSLAGGLSAGYGEIYGHGVFDSTDTKSSDATALKVYPLKALLIYRFDLLARNYNIPLVPFGKAGLVYELFNITNGSGDTATSDGATGKGGRWGYEGDVGLALMLDWFDEPLAKDFDIDVGVNHSYFFAEWRNSKVDNFGGQSIHLGSTYWSFGLALEY